MSKLCVPKFITPRDREYDEWLRTHPRIAGGAGWSQAQASPLPYANANAGTTGATKAFGSNVTTGNVIIGAAIYAANVTPTWTFSDSQTSPANTWTPLGQANSGTPASAVALYYTVAGHSAAMTVTWTNNQAASADCELYVGEFVPPSGTPAQDGAFASANSTAATVITPAGGGSGSNDLVINLLVYQYSWSAWGGSWASMGTPPSTGNACGYLINASGSSTPNSASAGGNQVFSAVGCISISAGGAGVPIGALRTFRMPLGV